MPSRSAAKFYVEDQIDRSTALKIVSERGSPIGRRFNIELINAFYDFVEFNPIEGVRAFDEMVEWFPLRRGVAIPIKPLSVIRLDGTFTPIFLCPWSQIAFNSYQASLYMTILEKSVFTLTDFEDSEGRIYFFPRQKVGEKEWQRKPVVWRRGEIPLLSDKELNEQIRVFFESKELARIWFQDHLKRTDKPG